MRAVANVRLPGIAGQMISGSPGVTFLDNRHGQPHLGIMDDEVYQREPLTPRAVDRRAFTLVELIVVLAILGLVASLTLPGFTARGQDDAPVRGVIARARQEAVQRAQTLALDIHSDGSWRVTTGATSLLHGTIAGDAAALRLRITPLGVCFAESPAPAGWDAVACGVPVPSTDGR